MLLLEQLSLRAGGLLLVVFKALICRSNNLSPWEKKFVVCVFIPCHADTLLILYKIGGADFKIEKVKVQDLQTGAWSASWIPKIDHPAIPPEMVNESLSKRVISGLLLGISAGCFKVTDEWNQILNDYEFSQAASFLTEAWAEKP